MKKTAKLSILISIVLIFLLGISAVSASDTDNMTSVTSDDDSQTIDNQDTTIVDDSGGVTTQNSEFIKEVSEPKQGLSEAKTKTFKDLDEAILANKDKHEITLNSSYKYDSKIDKTQYLNGIYITPGDSDNKTFTIHGNGHSICADGAHKVFNIIDNANLVLENLMIYSSFSEDGTGGAIYVQSNKGSLTTNNVTFVDNTAQYGGSIYSLGTLNIINSSFINNEAKKGGAIYTMGSLIIKNSTFNYNIANQGGAIYIISDKDEIKITIIESNFTNNLAENDGEGALGGAISIHQTNKTIHYFFIKDSLFENNTANYTGSDDETTAEGGAIHINATDTSYSINTRFINNIATDEYRQGAESSFSEGGAIKTENGGNLIILDSLLENNTAIYGGAISIESVKNHNNRVNIENTQFNNNQADYGGAIISAQETGKALLNILDSLFTNNTAIYGGAIASDKYTTTKVKSITFTNNTAYSDVEKGYGGAIYTEGNVQIKSSNFNNNTATFMGGAISSRVNDKNLDLEIYDCNFIDNNVISEEYGAQGGAISIDATNSNKQEYYLINNTIFNNNGVESKITLTPSVAGGGAIYIAGNTLGVINASKFANNYARCTNIDTLGSDGGAIKVQFIDTIIINDTDFENNSAYTGGAISIQSNETTNMRFGITYSNFTNNTAKSDGGAVSSLQNMGNIILKIIYSLFQNNTAPRYGGAIYADYLTNTEIATSTFIGNNATEGDGGAIYVLGDFKVKISTFDNNFANNTGGAISAHNSLKDDLKLEIQNSNFTNNTAKSDGGAIYVIGETIISKNIFKDNKAKDDAGAIYGSNKIIIKENIFTSNNALDAGGAIFIDELSIAEIIKSTFTNNTAYQGGAIINDENTTLNIIETTFTNNNAISGGAIINDENTTLNIIETTFTNNKALIGGAINNKENANLTLINTTFKDNAGFLAGGAIINSANTNLTITNTHFIKNVGLYGGAITNDANTKITIIESTFTNNTASEGGAIYNFENATLNITKSAFTNNTASTNGGAIYNMGNATLTSNNFKNDNAYDNGLEIYHIGIPEQLTMHQNTILNTLSKDYNNIIYGLDTIPKDNTIYHYTSYITYEILNNVDGKLVIIFTVYKTNENDGSEEIKSTHIDLSGDIINHLKTGKPYINNTIHNGTYTIYVNYKGSKEIQASNKTITFNVTRNVTNLETEIDTLNNKINNLDDKNENLTNKTINLTKELTSEKDKNEKLTTDNNKLSGELEQANKSLTAKNSEAANLQTQIGSLTAENKKLNNDLKTANSKVNDANANIKKVKAASSVKKSKNFKVTVTLNKKVKGKYVYVAFNGNTYRAKTNNKGVATITIKSKVIKKLAGKKVKYQVIFGQKMYKKSVKVRK